MITAACTPPFILCFSIRPLGIDDMQTSPGVSSRNTLCAAASVHPSTTTSIEIYSAPLDFGCPGAILLRMMPASEQAYLRDSCLIIWACVLERVCPPPTSPLALGGLKDTPVLVRDTAPDVVPDPTEGGSWSFSSRESTNPLYNRSKLEMEDQRFARVDLPLLVSPSRAIVVVKHAPFIV